MEELATENLSHVSISSSSEEQNVAVSIFLATCNFLLALIALIQLIRCLIKERQLEKTLSSKKFFSIAILVTTLIRGLYFAVAPGVIFYQGSLSKLPMAVYTCWNHICEILLLFAFYLLLLFWAALESLFRLGHETNYFTEHKASVWGPIFLLFALTISMVFVNAFWSWKSTETLIYTDSLEAVVVAILYFATSIGFFVIGLKLRSGIKDRFPSQKSKRNAQIVSTIAIVCTLCFLTKAAIMIYSGSLGLEKSSSEEKKFNLPWYATLVFFFMTESFPIALMNYFLRIPSKQQPLLQRRRISTVNSSH